MIHNWFTRPDSIGPSLGLKRQLLTLLGGSSVPALSGTEWMHLDAMAEQHRLQPLLSWQLENAGNVAHVPFDIQAKWREARHSAGLTSLTQQAALRLATAALNEAGIEFVALKGPRLAWRCYPEPALRPMRDIDLLVAPDAALPAASVLTAAGFAMISNKEMLAEALVHAKHLPPLWHEGLGVTLELHHRLMEPPRAQGYHVPQLDPALMLQSCEAVSLTNSIVPCPTPTQLLAHLMVHALYSHRLDCGPLILADIHFLLAAERMDIREFERLALAGGWSRGAGLLLALTGHYFGKQPLAFGATPPSAVLAAGEEAMLQDPAKREFGAAVADLVAVPSVGAFARGLTKRLRPNAGVLHQEGAGMARWKFWPIWAWRRLCRSVARVADRRAMSDAGNVVAIMRWLQGG